MSDVKPDGSVAPQPVTEGSEAANGQGTPTAEQTSNFLETLSEDGKAYLKGIGIESLDAAAFAKIVESGIKQKSSVSDKSRELEELRARLASQGAPTDLPTHAPAEVEEPVTAPTAAPASTPSPSSQGQGNGVSENDLFDLSSMIHREFPELADEASDGRLFAELRNLGYFGVQGINKREVYEYLNKKHATAVEIKELREFKEKYSQPDPSANPTYNPTTGEPASGTKDVNWARSIVVASVNREQVDPKLLAEARQILQSSL